MMENYKSKQPLNVSQGWVFIFRCGMVFSSVSFPFMSHHASALATTNLRRTIVFVGLGSNGFWFFGREVMFLKVGFLFFDVRWCFSE